MSSNEINASVWESLYSQGKSLLDYPNEAFVRLCSRILVPALHKNILDFGFGAGANLIHLAKRGFQMGGVEVSPSAIEITRKRCEEASVAADLRQLAATGIPFPEAYFDCVVAWQVLGYNDWETLQQAMAEIRRVLRPGGLFIGTITAAGDVSQGQATPLGDGLYCSRVAGQAGAIVLIVDEKDLARCFPGQTLTVGETLYRFDSVTSRHFIVSFNVETDGRGLV